MGRVKSPKGPNFKKKGRPTNETHQIKDVDAEKVDLGQEIAEKYTQGPEENPAKNIHVRHKNRNLDKPDIDKPAYD